MPMMAISSEAKIHVQLLNCQINLSPFLRNNVGTKVIAKSTKAIIAMPHILIVFILPLVKSRFISSAYSFLAIILAMGINDHRLLLEQFDQFVKTMFQFELQLFRV